MIETVLLVSGAIAGLSLLVQGLEIFKVIKLKPKQLSLVQVVGSLTMLIALLASYK